ncbi:hypothetical protein FSP39_010071 [Pinctada imbricata]|uniref:B box-type domain-containing protein n=1 Tax=Pinctada imbricata TaxID=66713 RepID=A0AA88XV05_PINIB|nr:hypothetical protein FSP39_010071 [Pinctada imbricata]
MATNCTAPCSLCDGKNEISRKCLNCDEFMCTDCSKIHLKSKRSKDHNVITVEDTEKLTALVLYEPRDNKSHDEECTRHRGEKYMLFCVNRECDCLVCSSCITEYHQGHRFVRIDDILTEYKRLDAQRNRDEIEDNILPYLRDKKAQVAKAKENVISDIENKKETIKQRYEHIRKQLDSHYKKTLSYLGETGKVSIDMLDELNKEVDKHITRLRHVVDTTDDVIDDENQFKVIKLAQQLVDDIHGTPEIQIPGINRLMLTPGQCSIEDVFGELQEVYECEPITISRAYTGFSEVSTLCPVSPYETWFGHYNHRGIRLLELDESERLYPTANFGREGALNLATSPEGDLYMVSYGSYDITLLKTDGTTAKVCDTSPLVALGIGMTKNRDVLLCLAEAYPSEMKSGGESKVARLTNFGVRKQEIEFDEIGRKIFVYPFRVGENTNGDIGVIDHVGDSEGKLVVVDSEGRVKFRYSGLNDDGNNDCNLTDLAFDNEGCILLTDVTNQTVHMLAKDGTFLRFLDIFVWYGSKLSPTTLALDSTECLWVGGVHKHRYFDRNDAYVLRVKYKL